MMFKTILNNIKKNPPVVHCITNYATANDVANAISFCGGSPIMADCKNEISQITKNADALVLNIGMLNEEKVKSMIIAGKMANTIKIPVILDPVGIGGSTFRQKMVSDILDEVHIDIIKGNISEMKQLAQKSQMQKSIDAAYKDISDNIYFMEQVAKNISKKFHCVAIITGKFDIIVNINSNGKFDIYHIKGGNPYIKKIIGTGCMMAGVLGVYCATTKNYIDAAISTSCHIKFAAKYAADKIIKKSKNAFFSYKMEFMDKLGNISYKELQDVEVIKKIDLSLALTLYAITPKQKCTKDYFLKIENALKSGITMLQLREKDLNYDEFIILAQKIKSMCKKYNVPLIINDNVKIASYIDADGVHLGQNDMSISDARKILGNKIIGKTAHNLEEAIKAEKEGANYLGVGAIFATKSKNDTISIDKKTIKKITEYIQIPIVAIGGINADNITQLNDLGLCGVAIISTLFSSSNINLATKDMLNKVKQIKDKEL